MKKIRWDKPASRHLNVHNNLFGRLPIGTRAFTFHLPERELLIPTVENAANPKDELCYLLKVAAEIEHALMVQYLYAAYSVSEADETGIRNTILSIAVQEMGHLLAVQNLLLSIGGIKNLHLLKSELRPESANNPLPFTLEPVSKDLLAKFVAIEAPIPDQVPENLKAEVEAIRMVAEKTGITLNPVGGLYMKIFWLFQENNDPVNNLIPIMPNDQFKADWHISDSDFLAVDIIEKYESTFDAWDTSGAATSRGITLSTVHNKKQALQLVYNISAQGEGANFEDTIPTHFELFLTAYRNFDLSPLASVVLPKNPVTKLNPEFKTQTTILNPYSLLWCELFNSVYTSLLYDIYSSMFYKQFSPDNQVKYVGLIIPCMRILIKSLSNVIVKLPLATNGFIYDQEPRCAATYEINSDFALPQSKAELDMVNNRIVDTITDKLQAIKAHPDFEQHKNDDFLEDRPIVGFTITQTEMYCTRKIQHLSTNTSV